MSECDVPQEESTAACCDDTEITPADKNDDTDLKVGSLLLSDVDVNVKEKKGNVLFLRRLVSDAGYRRRVLLTVSVCISYVMLGWMVLQVGVALTDLQELIRVDLETAAWLFTSWSLGYIGGSLVGGLVYDKFNRLVTMAVCSAGSGIGSIVFPWCRNFPSMVAVRAVVGALMGAIDTGANTIVPSIWGNDAAPFMQTLYLAYTLGGILSPFVTRPFLSLSQEDYQHHMYRNTTPNTGFEAINVTEANLTQTSNTTNVITGDDVTSDIHFAFLISGVIVMASAVPYLYMACIGDYDIKQSADKKAENDKYDLAEVTGKRKFVILSLLGLVNMTYSATEESLGDFLVSFCLLQLHWNKGSSLTLMSLYWTTSCVGGLAGVILVRYLGVPRLLFLAFVFWVISFLGLLISSLLMVHTLVWICVSMSGLFMVIIIPMVISWTEANVCDVNGKISSLFMISTGMGLTLNPMFIGSMMERLSNMCFIYILLGEAVLCFVCFTASNVVCKTSRRKPDVL